MDHYPGPRQDYRNRLFDGQLLPDQASARPVPAASRPQPFPSSSSSSRPVPWYQKDYRPSDHQYYPAHQPYWGSSTAEPSTQWVQAAPPQLAWHDPIYNRRPTQSYPSGGYHDPSYPPTTSHDRHGSGREYLASLTTIVSKMDIGTRDPPRQRTRPSPSVPNEPLPRLPVPPQIPPRPHSDDVPYEFSSAGPLIVAPASFSDARMTAQASRTERNRPLSQSSVEFVGVSVPTLQVGPSSQHAEPSQSISPASAHRSSPVTKHHISHSRSDTAPKANDKPRLEPKARPRSRKSQTSLSDFIVPDSESNNSSSSSSRPTRLHVTDRTPERRRRAASEQPRPLSPAPKTTPRRKRIGDKNSSSPAPSSSGAVRCSGFTRKGTACQRLVKSEAPYLSMLDLNVGEESKRYCKDHAGMICDVNGFYWRGVGSTQDGAGIWIDFHGELLSPHHRR